MRDIAKRLKLWLGLPLSLFFPAIFVFSQPANSVSVYRFIFPFIAILSIWITNFALIDFLPFWMSRTRKEKFKLYKNIFLSLVIVLFLYTVLAALDPSGQLFRQLGDSNWYSARAWFFLILRIVMFDALIILIKYLFDSHTEKQRKEMQIEILKRENIMALNESLKQQISPHFLFNSLNTLKALVKQSTDLSLEFIDELASVYRYMLSHYGKNEVTLEEEISFLSSYLRLLKLRFGESILPHLDIPDESLSAKIPPNTLQILIENAVKHNVLSGKRPLHISVTVDENYLIVQNNLQIKPPEGASSYVGLTNINNRYNILKGKGITIERTDKYFRVKLPIHDK